MGIDETMLQQVTEIGVPILRFYDWSQPAATFGYFQKIEELEAATKLRPLIRRPTGGGLVPHVNDWTYCLAFPPAHDWYSLRAEESYRDVHEWIRVAMLDVGVETELADCCKKEMPGQCFIGYEKFDVLQNGRKIAGAAQRRNNFGLLIQGSIQPVPTNVSRRKFVDAMISRGNQLFGEASKSMDILVLLGNAAELAASRYSSEGFNRRR